MATPIKEVIILELTYYKCPLCGFVYQVPEYWMDFSPEDTLEMTHINLETKELCTETNLQKLKP